VYLILIIVDKDLGLISILNFIISFYLQVWMQVIEKTEALSEVIKQQAEAVFNTTVDKLNTLILDRRAAKQMFQEEKTRYDQEFAKVSAT